MTITEKKQNDWLVLALADRLDTQTAPELEQVAMSKMTDGAKVALELSELQRAHLGHLPFDDSFLVNL